MKNPFKTYSFWLKIIGAALLIAFAIVLLVSPDWATLVVLIVTGLTIGIFSIIRIIPLLRSLTTGKARLTCLVEIAIHLVLAGLLIFAAVLVITKNENEDAKLTEFVSENYRFLITAFCFTRVTSYFMCTVLFKEETDKIKFWTHIGLILICCVLCACNDLKSNLVATILAVIALICATCLIVTGALGYGRYRNQIVKDREIKKEEQDNDEANAEEPLEAPADEKLIIPMIDDEPKDSDHVN